jgi:hypothetical protein
MKRALLLFTAAALLAAMMLVASPAQAQTFVSGSSNGGSFSNSQGFSNAQPITLINSFTGDIGGIETEPSTFSVFPGIVFRGGSFG